MKVWASMFLIMTGMTTMADETVNVFYLGGQSNATEAWRDGIESVLRDQYAEDEIVIVHAYHPGQWLKKWITHEPRDLFRKDFYNENQDGTLEQAWRGVIEQGKVPQLAGFFWLQGEGDTGNYTDQALYAARFLDMLERVESRFQSQWQGFIVAVIDGNQDPKFDDPEQAAGRTRGKIESMRRVHQALGTLPQGAAFDTRGFERTDIWHLTKAAQREVGVEMARQWLTERNP